MKWLNVVCVILCVESVLAKANPDHLKKYNAERARIVARKNQSLMRYKTIRRKPEKFVYEVNSQKITRVPMGSKLAAQATLTQPKELVKHGVGLSLKEKKPKGKRSLASVGN